jgi:hypothetical protein
LHLIDDVGRGRDGGAENAKENQRTERFCDKVDFHGEGRPVSGRERSFVEKFYPCPVGWPYAFMAKSNNYDVGCF